MLLLNGTLCDHSGMLQTNIRFDTKITQIGTHLQPLKNEEVLDCTNLFIFPALIDLGIYPKNKSLSTKTLQSLGNKCLSGGVGSILLYADTQPKITTESMVELINLINFQTPINLFSSIYPFDDQHKIGNIASLKSLGGCAIHTQSQDLKGHHLLTLTHYANMLGIPFITLPCDQELAQGVIDEGILATTLGLPSIPSIAWQKEIATMCSISANTKAPMLLTLLEGFEDVGYFNQKGAKITTQTPIHHMILDESMYANYSTKAKMFPPLKHQDQKNALIKNLQDGKIQCLTSLQSADFNSQKDEVFELASCGVDSIAYYFSLIYTYFVKNNIIDLPKMLELSSKNQADFLHLQKGSFQIGYDADFIIVDLKKSIVCKESYSPYYGEKLFGKVEKNILAGRLYE